MTTKGGNHINMSTMRSLLLAVMTLVPRSRILLLLLLISIALSMLGLGFQSLFRDCFCVLLWFLCCCIMNVVSMVQNSEEAVVVVNPWVLHETPDDFHNGDTL